MKPMRLAVLLEEQYALHHRLEKLDPDPLLFVRGYDDPLEGETAGLVAGAFAYGRVDLIVRALGLIFGALGPTPRQAILDTPPREWQERFAGFVYRFHKTDDVALFLHLLAQAIGRHGSLRKLFAAGYDGDVREGLARFCEAILAGDARPLLRTKKVPPRHPVRHLLASPAGGGAAKRLCLFLRWMCRHDELDPGHWKGAVAPADLVVPLDTHVAWVGRELGLTSRKSSGWKTAEEITSALRKFDPADPLRFDFSLFRFGLHRER